MKLNEIIYLIIIIREKLSSCNQSVGRSIKGGYLLFTKH